MSSIAKINGTTGIYDGKINNPSVRYGRNAIDNFNKYTQSLANPPEIKYPDITDAVNMTNREFSKKMREYSKALSSLDKYLSIPREYELQYATKDKSGIDKLALMGAAYEEMGRKTSASVQDVSRMLQEESPNVEVSAKALDINRDGTIDLSEYSTSILAADMLSTSSPKTAKKNPTGKINKQGHSRLLSYTAVHNYAVAKKEFQALHSQYNLDKSQAEFEANLNNLV